MVSLIEKIKDISNYVNNVNKIFITKDVIDLDKIFFEYQNNLAKFNHDFRVKAINSDEKIIKAINDLLFNLGIPETQWTRYTNSPLSFYDLLIELRDHYKNNEEVKLIINGIDNQHKKKCGELVVLGLEGILTTALFYQKLIDLWRLTKIQEILAGALFAPIVSIVFTVGIGLYSLYQSVKNKDQSYTEKLSDNLFLLLGCFLNITSYSLSLSAAVFASTVTPILFVVASVFSIIKETINLVINNYEINKLNKISTNLNLSDAHLLIRLKNEKLKHIKSIKINFVHAIAITGIIAAWCFVPGGLLVTGVCVLAMILAYTLKIQYSKKNESLFRVHLGDEFEDYEKKSSESSNNLSLVDNLESRLSLDDLPNNSKRTVEISSKATSAHIKTSAFGFFSYVGSKRKQDIKSEELEFTSSEDSISFST